MAFLLRPNQHERHKFIETTIENYLDVLDRNDAEQGAVHPDVSHRYREIVDNLVVPDLRNGVLSLGESALKNENFIPIWAMTPGRATFSSELRTPSLEQLEIDKRILSALQIADTVQEDILYGSWNKDTISLDPNIRACIVPQFQNFRFLGHTASLAVYGRPSVVLNMRKGLFNRTFSSMSPDTMHHEITHASRFLDTPMRIMETNDDRENDRIAYEIEADLHQLEMINEQNRQDYTPVNNEHQSPPGMIDILLAIQQIAQQHDSLTSPNYEARRGSETVRVAKELGYASIIYDSTIKNEFIDLL